jgi:diaminopimelate epimerase
MDLHFTKMHGCGNDFVVVDDRELVWDFDETAVSLICDRHFGVGADGMILVRPAADPAADFQMVYINADGSPAEMCGNGVRVFVRYLVDRGIVSGDVVNVQTGSGIKSVSVERDSDGGFALARVDMGEPTLTAVLVPTTLPGHPVLDAPLATDMGEVRVTCVSMGNPHAVIWVDDVDAAPVTELGPIVETHPAFPRGTNVEFAQLLGRGNDDVERIRLRVWERGVGETLACGTGACATAVAAALAGRTGRTVIVELRGGDLTVAWTPEDRVLMTGPAVEVYAGVLPIPEDED